MKRRHATKKWRRGKIRPREPLLNTQVETLIKPRRTILERVKGNAIIGFAGMLGTFLGLYSPISATLHEPEILHSFAQIDDPFAVRFSLHNPSAIIPMKDVRISCALLRVKLEYNLSLVDIPVDDGVVADSIPAEKTIEYECPIRKFVDDLGQISQATIRINAKYRTLGYERVTESEVFNWDVNSRQWTKGEIIN